MNRLGLLFIVVCSFLLFSVSVSALDTRINITMTETVNQNVSFAREFFLTESTDYCQINGVLNISNPSPDTVSDIYISFNNTDDMQTNFTLVSGRYGRQIAGSANGTVNQTFIVQIPELQSGNESIFQYNISCLQVNPPLNINTNYTNADHGFERKVLAGYNWTVNQSVANQVGVGQPVSNINITIRARNVTWNGTNDSFELNSLNVFGDYANVYGNGTNNFVWYWEPNGGTLAANQQVNISYNVTAPENIPTSGTYQAIFERVTYSVSYLASNLSIVEVNATSDFDFNVQKRIIQPSDNLNNTNVTWQANAGASTDINISYNLTQVTLWVTEALDPSNYTTSFGFLNTTYNPNVVVNESTDWATNSGNAWDFNFTDGSTSSSPPPIVWIRPYFFIRDAQNQILSTSITQSGNDYYMKYIYVINGYWLRIDKNISSLTESVYRIDIIVENIGTAWTPENLSVTAYDFVPAEFTAWNFSQGFQSNATVTGAGFNGTAYQWVVPAKAPYNSSLGPRTESYANRTWNATYYVNGTGEYQVSELYIVGLDPRLIEQAQGHEGITVISNLITRSSEFFYVFIVLFLIVLNIVNFMYTRKIADKLGK